MSDYTTAVNFTFEGRVLRKPPVKALMAATVARKAGVDRSKVTADVTAGSVNIKFTITAT